MSYESSHKQKIKMTGAEIVVATLIDEGVTTVFGYPGGQVLDIYDALERKHRKIRHILTAHEQGAAHAADGYARASGKTGVVIATSGPGAANLVTGIANAYLDSVPMVAITGNVPTDQIGRDSFQELDIADITMPITKYNYIVKDITKLQSILQEAFRIASEGRKGPVLVDIPKDIQSAKYRYLPQETDIERGLSDGHFQDGCHGNSGSDCEISGNILSLLQNAERPILYCGGGVVRADVGDRIRQLSEKFDIPVGCSLMGLAALPDSFPNKLGLTGMHGRSYATEAMSEADVILAVGARFTDRATGVRGELVGRAKIIQFDIDAAEIDKNVRDAAYGIGRLDSLLSWLLDSLPPMTHTAWQQRIAEKRQSVGQTEVLSEDGMNPYAVIDTVAAKTADMPVVTDVGQHQMWAAQRYPIDGGGFYTSGGLGTMGFGMGAAIGVSLAKNRTPVLLFTGDGCFGMNLNELATAVTYQIPLLIILMNNRSLGMVRQWQKSVYHRLSQTVLHRATDFPKLAEAFGAFGYAADTVEDLSDILDKIFRNPSKMLPAVVDCRIDPEAEAAKYSR